MANVLDANCWCKYVDETISQEIGWGTKVLDTATSSGGVLLDANGTCLQQYFQMRKPFSQEIYNIWFEEATLRGNLTLVELSGKPTLFKELGMLGVPKGEHIYFRLAVHGSAKTIVSNDIDFFDPSLKLASAASRAKALTKCHGPVCKHMKKNYSVDIRSPEVYIENQAA